MEYYNIAIDGPAGAGKSTIAKLVAKELGYVYVDTGAMYRALALHFLRKETDIKDEDLVKNACKDVNITIEYRNNEQIVLLNNENVNPYIRTEEVGKVASATSAYKVVREKLLELQRDLASTSNVVMDGRDIGTFVLPNANLKIFLTASSKERANRRYKELRQKGIECNLNEIEEDIINRDYADMNREISPLKQAKDAKLIDSSFLNIEEVVNNIINLI